MGAGGDGGVLWGVVNEVVVLFWATVQNCEAGVGLKGSKLSAPATRDNY